MWRISDSLSLNELGENPFYRENCDGDEHNWAVRGYWRNRVHSSRWFRCAWSLMKARSAKLTLSSLLWVFMKNPPAVSLRYSDTSPPQHQAAASQRTPRICCFTCVVILSPKSLVLRNVGRIRSLTEDLPGEHFNAFSKARIVDIKKKEDDRVRYFWTVCGITSLLSTFYSEAQYLSQYIAWRLMARKKRVFEESFCDEFVCLAIWFSLKW